MPNDDGENEGLRARKKKATRQLISDTATRLFIARGFEQVTVDEVAVAAQVSKMTVFNYFPRKEDLFFDRTGDVQQLLREAIGGRGRHAPIAALRALAHQSVADGHPITKINRDVAANWKVVVDSPALRARAFDLLQEIEQSLAQMLATDVGLPADDATARLVAGTILGAFRVAFAEGLRRQRSASAAAVREEFLELLDRGLRGASAMARGTPYAGTST